MSDEQYLWISKWETFQHYAPDRDRPPAWIKSYPKQMHDDSYRDLTDRQRALIRDLRDVFAIAHGRVLWDARRIAKRRGAQTRDVDLKALNHAGLIEPLSRTELDQRLERLYGEPRRPRASAREEGEREEDLEVPLNPPLQGGHGSRDNGTNPRAQAEARQALERAAKIRAGLERKAKQWHAEEVPTDVILDELIYVDHLAVEEAHELIATITEKEGHVAT